MEAQLIFSDGFFLHPTLFWVVLCNYIQIVLNWLISSIGTHAYGILYYKFCKSFHFVFTTYDIVEILTFRHAVINSEKQQAQSSKTCLTFFKRNSFKYVLIM